MEHQSLIRKLVIGLFAGSVLLFLYCYAQGDASSISWHVTTSADSESFYSLPFKKGPFEFAFETTIYKLAENFSAGPITRNIPVEMTMNMGFILGLCVVLALSTYLSRFWFIGIMALMIFFLINLHLDEIQLFGFAPGSTVTTIILLSAFLVPGYIFHAFATEVKLLWRIAAFTGISACIIFFSGVHGLALHDQFIVGGYYGGVVLCLIFLFFIAEEIVFAILYLITQSKGAKNNHIHFSVLSVIYLAVLIIHLGKKASFWKVTLPFFDPYLLLVISAGVAIWSIQFKKDLFKNILTVHQAQLFLAALGIIVMSFLSQALFRGNDPVYEGLHYFIIYAHVGFGIMFFLYLFWNFIGPLGEGLQVFKIAFKSGSFPYVTARIGGIVAIIAFFLLASKEAFFLFQAGKYNYQGAQQEAQGNQRLADEYYQEGAIYGYDNHYSNYQLGYRALQKENFKEANYRFKKASRRHPSPKAFVNYASTHALLNESTLAQVTLQEGLQDFPDNSQLKNNLGLVYAELGKFTDAIEILASADPDDEWNNAALVNLWKVVKPDSAVAITDYQKGNLAAKTNILASLIERQKSIDISFDTTALTPSYALHRLSFLINAATYFNSDLVANEIDDALSGLLDESIYYAGRKAKVLSSLKAENINRALQELDFLVADAPSYRQANYLNEMGLVALVNHAPELASGFFKRATDRGNQDAVTNQLVCYLEMGQFEAANSWADYLVSLDTSFLRLKRDIDLLDQREGLTVDQQLFRLYYKYQEYSPAEVNALLSKAEPPFIKSLWQKIANEQLEGGDIKPLISYRAVFNQFLPENHFAEADVLIALNQNQTPKTKHPLTLALNLENEDQKVEQLKRLAGKNALNEPLVLSICKKLKNIRPSAAYDVLVESININDKSVALYKQYVLAALESGLEQYAKDGLQQLTTITTQQDYQAFFEQYSDRKSKLDAQSDW